MRARRSEQPPEPADPSLFSTSLPDGVLSFGNVVLNGLHDLRCMHLQNLTDRKLCVSLRCNLEDQVHFQLENQNLQGSSVDPSDPEVSRDFNQTFNEISHIDRVYLEPRARQQLIVSVRPRRAVSSYDSRGEPEDGADDEGPIVGIEDSGVSQMRYHSFPFKPKVTMAAIVLDETGAEAAAVDAGGGEQQRRCQEAVVRVEASVCRSVLQVDRHELVFDDCIPGGVYSRDFTVWNLSETALDFSLYHGAGTTAVHGKLFQFTNEAEESEDVITTSSVVRVDAFSQVRVGVRFSPKQNSLGETDVPIILENANDSSNVETISIHSVVTKEMHIKGLRLSTLNDELDFGDCYTEAETDREVTLRNTTDKMMFVFLSTNQHEDVTFRMKDAHDAETDRRPSNDVGRDADEDERQVSDGVVEVGTSSSSRGGREGQLLSEKGGTGTDQERKVGKRNIEQINLNPGQVKTIYVRYRPSRTVETQVVWQHQLAAGQKPKLPPSRKLTRRAFKMWLRCQDEMDRAMETYTRMVQCHAKVCTSWFQLATQVLSFGDTEIGVPVTRVVQVRNVSDLPAKIDVRLSSSVLSLEPKAVTIPPNQTYGIQVLFKPTQFNTNYEKQVTFVNLNNYENEQVLEVRANITDQSRATLHSFLYSVRTAAADGTVNFGNCVVNSRSVQKVIIANRSKQHGVSLRLGSSSPEFRILAAKATSRPNSNTSSKDMGGHKGSEQPDRDSVSAPSRATLPGAAKSQAKKELQKELLDALERKSTAKDQRRRGPRVSDSQGPKATLSLPYEIPRRSRRQGSKQWMENTQGDFDMKTEQDLAVRSTTQGKQHHRDLLVADVQLSAITRSDSVDSLTHTRMQKAVKSSSRGVRLEKRNESWDGSMASQLDLIGEATPENFVAFADSIDEVSYVTGIIAQRKRIDTAMEEEWLLPISELELTPSESCTIYVLLEPNDHDHYCNKLQNLSGVVRIQLVRFDRSIATDAGVDIPQTIPDRELQMRAKVCRSQLSLQQKSINFGHMHAREERTRVIVVSNLSEAPLLYNIILRGTIQSRDLQVNEKRGSHAKGLIQPYRTKEIFFTFNPTMAEPFAEDLRLENVQDPSCTHFVTVKAVVYKPQTFELGTEELDFGPSLLAERSRTLRILLTNTTLKTRTYSLERMEDADTATDLRTDLYFQLDMTEREHVSEETKESMEAKLQKSEQSLKKLIRKERGNSEKARKLRAEIKRLRALLDVGSNSDVDDIDSDDSAFDSLSDSEDEDDSRDRLTGRRGPMAIENDDKPRKNYMMCTVKPMAMQLIFTTLVSRRLDSSDAGDTSRTRAVSGQVQAYETKNMDLRKEIGFWTIMCPTVELFTQTCAGTGLRTPMFAPSRDIISSPTKPPFLQRPSIEPPRPILEGNLLSVFPQVMDLGNVRVSESTTGRFELENTSNQPTTFIVIAAEKQPRRKAGKSDPKKKMDAPAGPVDTLRFRPHNGMIPPGNRFAIDVDFTGRSVGKQEHVLLVKIVTHGGTFEKREDLRVSITASVSHPAYLQSLDTDDGALNFGQCYIDPQHPKSPVKSMPFRLKNIHSEEVTVLAKSNMSRQVFIYSDAKLRSPADAPVSLAPGETVAFYIALCPLWKPMFENGLHSTVVGGIRVEVKVPGSKQPAELTYKFQATVSMSVLKLSDTVIDLGGSDKLGTEYNGSFTVSNITNLLPTEFEIKHTKWIKLTKRSGLLEGQTVAPTNSECVINYSVCAAAHGLLEESLTIVNVRRRSQELTLTVRLFVDDATVQSQLTQIDDGLQVLCLDYAYVTAPPIKLANKEFKGGETQFALDWEQAVVASTRTALWLRNTQSRCIRLRPESDADFSAHFASMLPEEGTRATTTKPLLLRADLSTELSIIGDEFTLKPGGEGYLVLNIRGLPISAAKAKEHLRKGKLFKLSGRLVLRKTAMRDSLALDMPCKCPLPWHFDTCSMLEERAAIIIKVEGQGGMSLGKIRPRKLELGEIGLVDSWKPKPFKFTIQNQCEIPLAFTVRSLPQTLSLNFDSGVVPAMGALECEGTLDATELKHLTSSTLTWDIVIDNSHNIHNVMKVSITAHLTTQLVGFRVDGVEHNTITLPEVQIPSIDTMSYVDQWFSVENLSDMPLDLHIGTKLGQDMRTLVDCILKSGEENVNVSTLTLQPKEDVELRVLAKAKRDARSIPQIICSDAAHGDSPRKYSIDKASGDAGDSNCAIETQLGEIVVTIGSGASVLRETLVLRGQLRQGPNFSASTRRLNLRPVDVFTQPNRLSQMPGQTNEEEEMDEAEIDFTFSDQLEITNLSSVHRLDYQVAFACILEPEEMKLTVTPSQGSVETGKTVVLKVEFDIASLRDVENFREDNLSGKVIVTDTNVKNTDLVVDINMNMTGWSSIKKILDATARLGSIAAKPGTFRAIDATAEDAVDAADSELDSGPPSPIPKAQTRDEAPANVVLGLQGCANSVYSTYRYDIDLGQQTLSTDKGVLWELTISSPSAYATEYRIYPVSTRSNNWLKLNNSRGLVSAMSPSKITLSLASHKMGRFEAYLMVENSANPEDLKTVRVRMEVVANFSKVRQEWFDVVIDGKSEWDGPPTISLGTCFQGRLYRHRSFVLVNKSKQTLDFVIRHDVEEEKEGCQLHFSSTNISLKKLTVVTVGPGSSMNVFIFYQVFNFAVPGARRHAIHISCRLIKGYQVTVQLLTDCCEPQLSMDNPKLIDFRAHELPKLPLLQRHATRKGKQPGLESDEMDRIRFEPQELQITIKNMSSKPADVALRNDTMFFLIRGCSQQSASDTGVVESPTSSCSSASGDAFTDTSGALQVGAMNGIVSPDKSAKQLRVLIPPGGLYILTVRPNLRSIGILYQQIMKEKFVEEHVTIYSRDNPKEHRWARLRISFLKEQVLGLDDQVEFFSSTGRSRSYPFQVLEETVVRLMRDFSSTAGRIHAALQDLAAAELKLRSELAAATSHSDGDDGDDGGANVRGGDATMATRRSTSSPAQQRRPPEPPIPADICAPELFADLLFELHYVTDELVFYALKDPLGSAFIFQLANMLFSVCMRHPIFCSHFTREGSPDSDSSAPPSCIPDAPFVRAFHRWADQVDTRGSAAAQDRPRSSGSPRVQRHSARSRAGMEQLPALLPHPLRKWISQLRYFLSFFQGKEDELSMLRNTLHCAATAEEEAGGHTDVVSSMDEASN